MACRFALGRIMRTPARKQPMIMRVIDRMSLLGDSGIPILILTAGHVSLPGMALFLAAVNILA
jgi:hypothetical protein